MTDYTQPAKTEDILDCRNAMFSSAFPCNPRPFQTALGEIIRDGAGIESDDARRILWILMAQSYGQMAIIDLCDEWRRLDGLYGADLK